MLSILALNDLLVTVEDVSNVMNIWLRVDEISVWFRFSEVKLAITSEYLLPPS